jgi:hypothetical protein
VEQVDALPLKLVFEQLQIVVGIDHGHCYAEGVDPMITGVGWGQGLQSVEDVTELG